MRTWTSSLRGRGAAGLLLLLALLPGTARADGDEGTDAPASARRQSELASARYAREQLVRRALQSVRPDRMEEDGVARARDDLKARRAVFLEAHRPSVEAADDLVAGEPGRGLIGGAARLYAWMAYVPPAGIHDLDVPLEKQDKQYPVIVYQGTRERPDFEVLLPLPEGETLAPNEQAARERARRQAAVRLRARNLDVLRRPDGLVQLGATNGRRFLDLALEAMRAEGKDAEEELGSIPPTRLALTDQHELSSRMSRAYLAARAFQVSRRLEEYAADAAPTGLVSERAVEEKQQQAAALQARVDVLEKRQAGLDGSLDWLVWAERQLTSELGTLGYQLEEAKAAVDAEVQARKAAAEAEAAAKAEAERKAREEAEQAAAKDAEAKKDDSAPKTDLDKDEEPTKGEPDDAPQGSDGGDDPVDPADEEASAPRTEAETQLMSFQLQEAVLKLEMRLLYLTVHRAVLRGQLYEQAIELAKDEAAAAAGVADRYRSELNRMRREQQLEILDSDKLKLESLITDATSRAEDPEHENRDLWRLWQSALGHLQAVNRLTREAVQLRRTFESKLSPPRDAQQEPPAENAETSDDPMRRFRHPGTVSFDEQYVADVRAELSDPAFDIGLVARHHEVVSERIESIEEGLALLRKDRLVETSLKTEVAAAEADLAKLKEEAAKLPDAEDREMWVAVVDETLREDFATTCKAFEETLRGLDEKSAEARSLLQASRNLERALRDLGPRSFGIRIERSLDGENLGAAYDDAQGTLDAAARWLTGRGEQNLGTWVKAHWLTLLACLGLIAAATAFVRLTRRALDRFIGGIARKIPALRFEPVTVRAEEANAKREKAEQELAAKAAEEEALRLVSKEEAGKAQKMGEGGYSGEAE